MRIRKKGRSNDVDLRQYDCDQLQSLPSLNKIVVITSIIYEYSVLKENFNDNNTYCYDSTLFKHKQSGNKNIVISNARDLNRATII